tara:strand:+ start:40 stop:1164 length:1125 start_codon:yes stop_codon:yes gene_type:complete
MKKCCYVVANRSDYAKAKYLLQQLDRSPDFDLRIIITGSFVNPKYGRGEDDLLLDRLQPWRKIVNNLDDDSVASMVKSSALHLLELSSAIAEEHFDFGLVVGDRFDALPTAYAFSLLNIPTVHIQGGERTGTIDDLIRDIITKMSHIHLVANDDAKKELLRLGEDPNYIYVTGCPSVDYIKSVDVADDVDMRILRPYCKVDFSLSKEDEYFLVMIHPNVVDPEDVNIKEIFAALDMFSNTKVVFYPNNDPFHQDLVTAISKRSDYIKFKHLPMDVFIMLMAHCKCVIGNSSAGIREASLFGSPVVNIGRRQHGRKHGANVLTANCQKESIVAAINEVKDKTFEQFSLYGDGDATSKIIDILRSCESITYKNIIQ